MKEFDFSKNWWQFLIVAVVCYFIGCCNFALLISRSKHKDITKMGSGNPGTMNMSREFGLGVGFATFLCDALKGGLPAVATYLLYRQQVFAGTSLLVGDFVRYFAGLFVVVGHIFPVTMKFKGGKGIAATLGLFWFGLSCENPWWLLAGFGVLLLVVLYIYVSEWGSMGSLIGVTAFSVIQMLFFVTRYQNIALNAYLVALFLIILFINSLTWGAHHLNLRRLFSGEEHRTSLKKLAKKK